MSRFSESSYEQLNTKLSNMAQLVQQVISRTIDALARLDMEQAQEIIRMDEEIDRAELEIDDLVVNLIALRQPMATDLRFIVTALKINNDLERMGDQATNIAKGVMLLEGASDTAALVDLGRMEDIVQKQVHGCITAFTQRDGDLARQVCKKDDLVDAMNKEIIRSLVAHARENPEAVSHCVSLVLITRNLERISDLCTNIAEDVVYAIEGNSIKHSHQAS